MDKPVRDAEREKSTAVMNSKMGLYLFFAGIFMIVAKFIWGTDVSIGLSGAVSGGGLVFWGMNYSKASDLGKKLDSLCYKKYGKSYKDSYKDIIEDEGHG
ncbi:hypothetical protein AB7160_13885 [Morganella morganii]|uniref:hypothetical protein n=1 Tax=Morganella morganii TaxID=582 RepID=UPI001BD4C8D2|nr:hypothetical protein [Morganella morganii]MBS9541243.1 hypothetical protein [Morganella morganii subsp. morganii]MBT0317632.1 hypothetical protein [Morganella morganii subsp. morganii]MBT0520956.1 hypothetical protein [Morganella morganii subsp. morganii]QWL88158.1 hypothetical protein IZ187_11190 [Morganella morganii subsp. morganii]